MRATKTILAIAVLTAIVGLTSAANASTVQLLGMGSSAMYQDSEVAVFTDLCSSRAGSDCHHWSIKGKNAADGQNYAQALDSRSPSIPAEGGSFWAVWDNNNGNVWAYLSVDTIVGNRCYFAVPRCTLQLDSAVTATAGANLISSTILLNQQTHLDQADESSLPSSVATVLQTKFNFLLSDVRPEDAKFETNRVLGVYNAANVNGMGYGVASANCPAVSALIGCPILSSWTSGAAHPVQYKLFGKDPINTTGTIPKWTALEVGAAPLIFVYNNTNSTGLGKGGFTDITFTTAMNVFGGKKGLIQDLPGATGTGPLSVLLREPLSGTMTATEFTTFRVQLAPSYVPPQTSQEKGINLATGVCPGLGCPNPLNLASADGGVRLRGIGTGEIISGNTTTGVGGILHTLDSIGYAFFSYGNVKAIAGALGVGRYVTLDGVDGIAPAGSGGVLPTCTSPCPIAAGTSFTNVRNGTYRAWSIIRAVADTLPAAKTCTTNPTAAICLLKALVTAAQNEVNKTVPDFVPAAATTDGDPGMLYYRSHYTVGGASSGLPNNGNTGSPDNGGDISGCPLTSTDAAASTTAWKLNGTKTLGACLHVK